MGGFFGAVSRKNCKYDVFFGTDYHSHLGTKRGGLAFYDETDGFQRQIHNIENTPFRTKFEKDMKEFAGHIGMGLGSGPNTMANERAVIAEYGPSNVAWVIFPPFALLVLDIVNPTAKTVDELKKLNLPAGVDITIKTGF